jgi:hypothetical protein
MTASKVVRAKPIGYMTMGEKAIWAAAYVAEFRHWMTTDPNRRWQPSQAANFAIEKASTAVLAAREAVDPSGIGNAVDQAFLKTMVSHREVK